MKNITLLLSNWWGTGIVHCKVWISDNKDIYIGSANNDWKSLTQVQYFTSARVDLSVQCLALLNLSNKSLIFLEGYQLTGTSIEIYYPQVCLKDVGFYKLLQIFCA